MHIPGLIRRSSAVLALLMLASTPVQAKKQDLPEITVDGLHLVQDSKMAIVYADPDADLAPYTRVKLLDAHVAFRKNWERDQRRSASSRIGVSSKDIERIKTNLAKEFRIVFTEVLEAGGFPVVDETGEDVLLVRPAIVNLDPNAPELSTPGRSYTYVTSAGEMTLYVELYDSQTSDLLAKALDRRVDRDDGFYTWANSASNKAAADRILKGWATILLDALNEAKE
jgi:hypothetical protein